jgi:LysM repeat protein
MIEKPVFCLLLASLLLAGCGQPSASATDTTGVSASPTPSLAPLPTVSRPATFTPAPATPGPTPTPTFTPTPIVYQVVGGDTLSAIAVKFGVSAEAIQEANGVLDPRRLQIGQSLIIPEPEPGEDAPPSPTPTPVPLQVQGFNLFQNQRGNLWAWGEVFNPGSQPVSEVRVQVTLLDADGLPLAAETGLTQLDVILPGEAVAFALLFSTSPPEYPQYQVVVLSGVPLPPETRYTWDLTVSDLQEETLGSNMYRVTGRLTNSAESDVEMMQLLVTGYDKQGRVVSARQPDLSGVVLPVGGDTSFSVELPFGAGEVATYSIKAQGLKVE